MSELCQAYGKLNPIQGRGGGQKHLCSAFSSNFCGNAAIPIVCIQLSVFMKEGSKKFENLKRTNITWSNKLQPNAFCRTHIWQVLPTHNIFLLQDVFLLILQHSDMKFESKHQFCNYVENCPKIGSNP